MAFTELVKAEAFRKAGNKCQKCHRALTRSTAEFHHKTAVASGGTDAFSNCQVLCEPCHRQTRTYGG